MAGKKNSKNVVVAPVVTEAPEAPTFTLAGVLALSVQERAALDTVAIAMDGSLDIDDKRSIVTAIVDAMAAIRKTTQGSILDLGDVVVEAAEDGQVILRNLGHKAPHRMKLVPLVKLLTQAPTVLRGIGVAVAKLRVENEQDGQRCLDLLATAGVEPQGQPIVGSFPEPTPRGSKNKGASDKGDDGEQQQAQA